MSRPTRRQVLHGSAAALAGAALTAPPWNDVTPADMLDHTKFYTYS